MMSSLQANVPPVDPAAASSAGRSIFRRAAIQRYVAGRDRLVFPRFRHASRRRVPVLLQLNETECGAACLAMILSHHGRQTRVAECRERCGVGRDGVTAQPIASAARSLGLRVKAYSVQQLADFGQVPLPAIVHWNFDHFVVVERWSPVHVDIVDPALGRRRLDTAEFDASFTGVVLTFEPGVQFEQRGAVAQLTWRAFLSRLLRMRGTPGSLARIILASLALQALGLALPLFTQVLVDHILPLRLTDIMALIGLAALVLVSTQAATSYVRSRLLLLLQTRLDSELMPGFFEHLLSLPFSFFQQRSSGDLLMRLGSNAMIREILTGQTMSTILDGGLVLVYLAIMLWRDPLFGALALGIGMLQAIVLLATTRRVRELSQRDLAAQAEAQSYLVEALEGVATLKASGAEPRALERWSNLFTHQLNVALQRGELTAKVETALTALRVLSPLALLWVGAFRVLDGAMSLGAMLALSALAGAFLGPLTSLVSNTQRLQLVGAHLERLSDVLEAEAEQDPRTARAAPTIRGDIELRGVSFRYAPDAPLVLRDVSLAIAPGQKVAIVGRTGSGKSTLAKLLLGLYSPTEGEILYDGFPLCGLDYATLRGQFGVVLQEAFIFSGSIRENIAFSDPGMALEQVVEAACLATIHDDILGMPMGYETRVAEGGSGLSGGQRQRLSLARALAHRPAVLLLDEATSHLDAVTEQRVDRNLGALSCTRIVIAHRLSTIRNADLILVLEDGEIVERGTHGELLAREGLYTELTRDQSSAARASSEGRHDHGGIQSPWNVSRHKPSNTEAFV